MRLKNILFVFIFILFYISFKTPKCEHEYVAIEPPEIDYSTYGLTLDSSGNFKNLICVKCFNKIKQTVKISKEK